MSFPEITEEEEELFTRLASKMKLNFEIENMKIEIEKNTIKSEIEGIDLTKETSNLKARKKVLEEEYEEISGEFQYLTLKQELNSFSVRLQKLEERRETISETVYNSLYEEYLGKQTEIQSKLSQEEIRIREIQSQCRYFLEKLTEVKEELIIRSELGEINDEELRKKLTEFDDQKSRAEDLVSVAKDILD
ncbi:MAG: hypothetical protein ACW967_01445 [Candidatus Hodarchaeales archaeon]|jgi:copper chaperone CopZ